MSTPIATDEAIIAAVHADTTGSLTKCGKAVGFQGKSPGVSLSHRIQDLKKRRLLTDEDTAKFKQLGRKHIDRIPDEVIIAAVRADMSGSLRQCGKAIGFQGKSTGVGLFNRIQVLKKRGLLTDADTAKFKQLGRKHIDRIPDEVIIAAVRADMSGSLRQCGKAVGFLGASRASGLSVRIKKLIADKKLTVEEAERRFPNADWREKVLEEDKVRAAMELRLPLDEIATDLDESKRRVRKFIQSHLAVPGWVNEHLVDYYRAEMQKNRTIPRAEFIRLIQERESIRAAAEEWKLEPLIVTRRLARYGQKDPLWFEQEIPTCVRMEMAIGMSVLEQDRTFPTYALTAFSTFAAFGSINMATTMHPYNPHHNLRGGATDPFLTKRLLHHGGRVL